MSLIYCLNPCIYQQDGYCFLSRATSAAAPGGFSMFCVHKVPKHICENILKNGIKSFSDVTDTNQLKSFRNN